MPPPADLGGDVSPSETGRRLDPEFQDWLDGLRSIGRRRDEAFARLHGLLLRVARHEVRRRSASLHLAGPELDDIAHQAAADAIMAIIAKLDSFRGESRFTTWAYKFVILEVSGKIGRHFWRSGQLRLDQEDWDRLPDHLGAQPDERAEWSDLLAAVRAAVDQGLTDYQRRLFVAIVVDRVPVDALALELDTSRNAIYKALYDARRKLRANLAASGHIGDTPGGTS